MDPVGYTPRLLWRINSLNVCLRYLELNETQTNIMGNRSRVFMQLKIVGAYREVWPFVRIWFSIAKVLLKIVLYVKNGLNTVIIG